jgi:integrase
MGLKNTAKPQLSLVPPPIVFGAVQKSRPPRKQPIGQRRQHLFPEEVERLIKAAGDNRWGHRDATMILLAFRHGLRSAELVSLRWDQIDFSAAVLHVSRSKGGVATTHPLGASEMRALRRLKREQPASPFVFVSERDARVSGFGFAPRPCGWFRVSDLDAHAPPRDGLQIGE